MEKKCFEFKDYKTYLKYWISIQPGGGRGLYRKLATHLRIHSTMMSHIIRGKQNLTEDQALATAEYIGLSDVETDYFLELVRFERAATPKLRDRITRRLDRLRERGQEVKNRIEEHHQLTPEESARFYSSWFYSAIRLLSDIPEFQNRNKLVTALGIPRELANEVISFLIEKGLCKDRSGKIEIGPSKTHLPADSPYVWTLHKNWRLKAIEHHAKANAKNLFYTAPMSIAEADAAEIRELIMQTVAKLTQIAAKSRAETLMCLNIDWFDIV